MDATTAQKTNIRLPKDLYDGLRVIATVNNVTVTEYVRDLTRPYAHLHNPVRYKGLSAIREAVHTATSSPDTEAIGYLTSGTAVAVDLHGVTVWESDGVYVHRIVKYEGETTADVVSAYAEKLWDALNKRFPKDDSEWSAAVEDFTGLHRFVVARVNFHEWAVFESSAEIELWRTHHGAGTASVEPVGEKEWAIYGWAKDNLRKIYESGGASGGELNGQLWLNVYADVNDELTENEWARVCVQNYREVGADVEELRSYDFRFVPRVIAPRRRKRAPHIELTDTTMEPV